MVRHSETYLFSGMIRLILVCMAWMFSQAYAETIHHDTEITAETSDKTSVNTTRTNTLFFDGLKKLESKKYQDIKLGLTSIAESLHKDSLLVLNALVEGKLYRHKKQHRIVLLLNKEGSKYNIQDIIDATKRETVKKRAVKKVKSNNRLRKYARSLVAGLSLQDPDPEKRINALRSMLGSLSSEDMAEFERLKKTEKDADMLALIEVAEAIIQISAQDLSSQDSITLVEAVKRLEGSMEPSVKNKLVALAASTKDPAVKNAVDHAIKVINDKAKAYGWVETLFFGLSLGSVLVLAGIGLAITFGVMGVINMAHGELIMIGAYTAYVIQLLMPNHIGASLFVAVPAAFLVSGLVGIAIERGVIRHLYGRPLETLLATFGISLILQQTVRSIFSPLNRSVETPQWMSGVWEINPVLSLTLNRLYIILFCLIVFALLFMVLRKTRLGLQVRAVSQNRAMARAMGVRSQWVDALTFGLGSGVAGVAGVALSQLTNVGPNMGQAYIIDSFMVVVFGGVGNLWGTLVAGMSLGVANKVLEPVSGAVLAKILVLIFIILFIQKRPRGLFPQKGRAAEG